MTKRKSRLEKLEKLKKALDRELGKKTKKKKRR
jgi:hypothetical protein